MREGGRLKKEREREIESEKGNGTDVPKLYTYNEYGHSVYPLKICILEQTLTCELVTQRTPNASLLWPNYRPDSLFDIFVSRLKQNKYLH